MSSDNCEKHGDGSPCRKCARNEASRRSRGRRKSGGAPAAGWEIRRQELVNLLHHLAGTHGSKCPCEECEGAAEALLDAEEQVGRARLAALTRKAPGKKAPGKKAPGRPAGRARELDEAALGEEESRRLAERVGFDLPPGGRIVLEGELPDGLLEALGLRPQKEGAWPLKPFFGQPLDFELGLLMALRRGLAEVKARNGGRVLGWDDPSGRGAQ